MKQAKIDLTNTEETMSYLYNEIDVYNSPEQVKKRRIKKGLVIAGDVVFATIIAIFIFLTVLVNVAKSAGNVPFLFGYSLQYVQTGSMEPTIPTGSVIISRKVDIDTEIKAEYYVGDIITFYSEDGSLITHRAVVKYFDPSEMMNFYTTKGDANNAIDKYKVPHNKVVSIYVSRFL